MKFELCIKRYIYQYIYTHVLFLFYVVMFLLFCVARFLGGLRRCAFLIFVGFLLLSEIMNVLLVRVYVRAVCLGKGINRFSLPYINVLIRACWPTGV
jgi:hypothetical protein